MPRPNEQSSTHALTSTLHAIPDWFQAHRAALQAELGPSADHDRGTRAALRTNPGPRRPPPRRHGAHVLALAPRLTLAR